MVKFGKPIDQKTEERTYLVSSSGRQNNGQVKITPALKNVTGIEVVHARIPHSRYTIEEDSNMLIISISSATLVLILKIPVGDYTGEGLCDAITSQKVVALKQDIATRNWKYKVEPYSSLEGANIYMSYDATRNKFRFESPIMFLILIDSTCLHKLGLQSENINAVSY